MYRLTISGKVLVEDKKSVYTQCAQEKINETRCDIARVRVTASRVQVQVVTVSR